MLKRILELLDYVKSDISVKGLDYVFPEVKNVFYLDKNGDTDFIYVRIDSGTFHVAKSLYERNRPDFASEVSSEELLETIKLSEDDYNIRIQKNDKSYDVTLVELV